MSKSGTHKIYLSSKSEEFVVEKVVGQGTFGVVHKAVERVTGDSVAIKSVFRADSCSVMLRRVLRELRVLHVFRHENIIRLVDIKYVQHEGCVYFVTELSNQDLLQLISYNRAMYRSLSSDDFRSILTQILKALDFLHENRIIHRDLKVCRVFSSASAIMRIP